MTGVRRLLPPAIALLLRAWGRTWRIQTEGCERSPMRPPGPRFIYATWHRALLVHGFAGRDHRICVGVSEHADGELGARAAEHLGYLTARGSSTRGALRLVRELLEVGRRQDVDVALTPDGPKGPAAHCKPGVVYLAAALGRPVVPIGGWARPHVRLRSWDGFLVPLPFARVAEVFGEPLHVERHPGAQRMEELRAELDRRINECEARAQELVEQRGGPLRRGAQQVPG